MVHIAGYRFKYAKRKFKNSTTIIVDVSISGKRWRKSLGFDIPDSSFSQERQRLTSRKGLTPSEYSNINSTLARLQTKAEKIFCDHLDQDLPLNIEVFKRAFELPEATTLSSHCEMHIQNEPYKPTSEQQLRRAVHLVCQAFGYEVSLYDLSDAARVLEKHMVSQELSFNTRQKYHGRLKTLIRSAIRTGYSITNPYQHFQIHSIKGTRTYLEFDELETLIGLFQSRDLPDHLNMTLETFLFCCFTGLRYSDVMEITSRNIVGDELHCYTVKGKRFSHQLRIPLPNIALEIVEHRTGKLFKPISSQRINENLRNVIGFAGIQKNITFHCARHTFGTLFIALGGELMVLKELLGHSKISTTTVYVKMANGVKKSQIKLFDERFGSIRMSNLHVVQNLRA